MKTRRRPKAKVVVPPDHNYVNLEENDEIEVVDYDDSNGHLQSSLLREENEDEQRQEASSPSKETESLPVTQPESSESIIEQGTASRPNLSVVSSSDTSGDAPAILPRVVRSSRSEELPQIVAQPLDDIEQLVVDNLAKRPRIFEQRNRAKAKKRRTNTSSSSSSSSTSSSGSAGSYRGLLNNSHSNMAAPRRIATPPVVSTQSRRPRNILDKSIHGG